LLLDNGADVNAKLNFGQTPLFIAAVAGHESVVRILLERGANVCLKTAEGTAEEFARARGSEEIANLLRDAGVAAGCK
jgi:ankyrin repeat protein